MHLQIANRDLSLAALQHETIVANSVDLVALFAIPNSE